MNKINHLKRAVQILRNNHEDEITLRQLYRENKHYENTTRFFIKKVPFGRVE